METFAQWLNNELEKRGWSRSEAARRGGVSASMFDKVISDHAQAGIDFCLGIARAFNLPPEQVLRTAGLLPPLPGPEEDKILKELVEIVKRLDPDERQEILDYALWRYRRKQDQRSW